MEANYNNSVLNTFYCTISLMHGKLLIADGLPIYFPVPDSCVHFINEVSPYYLLLSQLDWLACGVINVALRPNETIILAAVSHFTVK